jgi:hypothetical protein
MSMLKSGRFPGITPLSWLALRVEIRISAPGGVLLLFEYASSYLQEKMCSTLAPPL